VVVIGAGAAGTMAAIFAAEAGADTVLIERTQDGGRKILISGGGRCNVLPAAIDESRYVTDSSPNLLNKLLRSWPLHGQRAFFEDTLSIPLVEEVETRKLFPASHRARDVRDGLMRYARDVGVAMRMGAKVTGLVQVDGRWSVSLDNDQPVVADRVIVATGGLSVPNTGSDGTGLRILEQLGHAMHPTYAALTPLTSSHATFAELSGISLSVSMQASSDVAVASSSGGFLFTHRGYSGPSVLDVSHVAVRANMKQSGVARVVVQWTPLRDGDWEAALAPRGNRTVTGALRAEMPDRLADLLVQVAAVDPARMLSELRRDERRRLIDTLVRYDLPVDGDEGYKKAEVTGGGVALGEVHPRTMESRRCAGLYLCGEVLDAFGPIGGHNFAWAWATGRLAGMAAGRG
jgi:predicted Rossmann fold flavoprotein